MWIKFALYGPKGKKQNKNNKLVVPVGGPTLCASIMCVV